MNLCKCPMCGTALQYPDVVQWRAIKYPRKTRRVIVGVRCSKCPAVTDVFADTGALCCFTPNQPLKVRVAR